MADVSSMTLLDGSSVNLKDAAARESISSLESSKVDVAQGLQNANKFLKVGSNGSITLVNEDEVGSGDVAGPNSSTDEHVAIFDGTTGKVIKDSGYTIGASVPSDAVFTDTTYSNATMDDAGLMSAADKTKLDGIATGATANVGTITGITMNGSSKGTSGVVDLGTVITSHQDISGKVDTSSVGVANGVAELDENGKVPSSQLPSYVDDVLEYSTMESFPVTGEAGKIYVETSTNLSYRWSGSTYVMIASSLAIGETSSTAYRGDRGATAYSHATDSSRLTTAQTSGLYKIATTAEGHVASVDAVQKSDITSLGIPGQDTTYSAATQSAAGLMSAEDKTKLDGMTADQAVYTDLDIIITTSMWTGSGPYTYTYTHSLITEYSGVFVQFKDGIRGGLVDDLHISHTNAGIVFSTDEMPIGDVPLLVRVVTSETEAMMSLNASDVATTAISGQTNVQGALGALNTSATTSSQNISSLQSSLAIVAAGDTHPAIPAGAFVYVKGHSTLADGLYTNTYGDVISQDGALSSSNLTADSSGGFNTLNNNLTTKASKTELNGYVFSSTYEETTSSTGAVSLKTLDKPHRYLNALIVTGGPGFVFRRDDNYFTVLNNSMQPLANTSVKFIAYFAQYIP